MSNLEQEVKDKLTKVCICKAITLHAIKTSIRDGAKTVEAVAEQTGATTGACRGGRCRGKIQELITGYENQEWQ